MSPLNNSSVKEYLSQKNILKKSEIKDVIELKQGNSMYVFRVCSNNQRIKSIIVRQAQGYARAKREFEVTPKRLDWEITAIEKYNNLLSDKKILPEIIYFDSVNHIAIIIDSLGDDGKYFFEEYKNGNYYTCLVDKFANFFAELHGKTYGINESEIWMSKEMHKFWTEEAFYRHYLLAFLKFYDIKLAENIVANSKKAKHAFCWLDPLPKNIVVGKDYFKVYDFEQATIWDPAYDIGAFIMPWYFQYLMKELDLNFVTSFLSIYKNEMRKVVGDEDLAKLITRAKVYLHTSLLHVATGNDVWDFIAQDETEKVVKFSKEFFGPEETAYKQFVKNL